ncbi:MAG: class I adenylate-forming enzyme family protein [Acidimicrobiales bacterium]
MRLSMLLDMAADGFGDRTAVGSRGSGPSFTTLGEKARRAARWISQRPAVDNVVLVDTNSEAVPILLYGSGIAGVPFAPLNYRLADAQLAALLARTAPSVAVVEDQVVARVGAIEGVELVERSDFLAALEAAAPVEHDVGFDPDDIAVLLFTSGTTGEPKAAVLRHRHLTSYVVTSVEFMGAADDEAALVSVPPYHVAGISAVLSGTFSGRRTVYLEAFSPEGWVATVRDEAITHAMVVPTMLGRILEVLERDGERLPSLCHLSYGGGRMPTPVVERALAQLPHVDLVNAYGLTETSSTISVLGPDDHRRAASSDDPVVRGRLGSVGRPLPGVEVTVRSPDGEALPAGAQGEVWVRGDQVAGEYLGRGGADDAGWFATRDGGWFDDDGFLFLTGRLDDVIVRGAENISPGEIEEVLGQHPAVEEVAVVGIPDTEWGETVAAAVVLHEGASASEAELQQWVRSRLRSSRTPAHVDVRPSLPYNDTGKLLRRVLKAELAAGHS